MLKTPKIHFNRVLKEMPEMGMVHDMMVRAHASLTNDELRKGLVAQFVDALEGAPKFIAYQMMMYARFGQNSYVVGPKVQDMFRRTELSKITPDMVVEPQTSFYIALPDCPWRIWGGPRTQWHHVEGIYVSVTDSIDSTGLWGDPQTVGVTQDVKRERGINVLICAKPNERSVGPSDDATLWFNINLERWVAEGEDIETFFQSHAVMQADHENTDRWEGRDPLDPFAVPLLPDTEDDLAEQRETLVSAVRLILNLCLYLRSDGPELETDDAGARYRKQIQDKKAQAERKKSAGKRKKIERQVQDLEDRIAELPRTKVIYVGPLFEQLDKPTREQNRACGGTHATPIEHAVPPHWQHYWVGSAEDRRKILRHKGMYRRGTGKPDRTIVKIRE